ncbi:NF-kappa-B-repressing factor [Venturia canescens]|uniref:NF-kappa-B-repressing factor n=1 Tax=Venturia canescens TaxID=32260 RepID=UPI001C9C92D9|nr:NF-kappa-B-repressing factor [Venturia canescens]
MTTIGEDWDVEKHKVEHECDEHWELRRNFLETHKDKFPEEQLVCLAQVFTNVELLGCRYPKETMDLVAELSQDVAKEYRERQKTKLQRTFVKASDAASSKVKGLKTSPSDSGANNRNVSTSKINFVTSQERNPCKKMKVESPPYGRIIVMQHPEESPTAVIQKSAAISKANLEYKIEKKDDCYNCEIYINSVKLAEGIGTNHKKAKAAASLEGLPKLQKIYYTIKVKRIERTIDCDKNQLMGSDDVTQDTLASDNVGSKMMKMMGWSGGGLGKAQQGIIEPVTVERQLSREGFGLKLNSTNVSLFTKKARETLSNYVKGHSKTDLVFAPEFTNEERSVIHKVARELGLKAASFGPKNKRTLVISRKCHPADLVQELLAAGGSNEKYELIDPTGT